MYLIFDTETTAKKPTEARIIQLAALGLDDQGNKKAELNILIKPDGWKVSEEITEITGITHQDCEDYGVPIRFALSLFYYLIKNSNIIIAHNLNYDYQVVGHECSILKKPNFLDGLVKFCTMHETTNIVKIRSPRGGYKWPKLQEAYKFFFKKEFENAHDAMADVKACAEIFFELRNRVS